jgi:hypothetical protein
MLVFWASKASGFAGSTPAVVICFNKPLVEEAKLVLSVAVPVLVCAMVWSAMVWRVVLP